MRPLERVDGLITLRGPTRVADVARFAPGLLDDLAHALLLHDEVLRPVVGVGVNVIFRLGTHLSGRARMGIWTPRPWM